MQGTLMMLIIDCIFRCLLGNKLENYNMHVKLKRANARNPRAAILSYNRGDKHLGGDLITKVFPAPFSYFLYPSRGTEKSNSFSGVWD